jgi:hypothetical protein
MQVVRDRLPFGVEQFRFEEAHTSPLHTACLQAVLLALLDEGKDVAGVRFWKR